ncbi:hypothetical protein SAMN02910456_01320 [Ruminococcaceae bacterium YRB3002]|nr:hypothetical protein SAMN02910456_01320 [Ruminococcaceae bacterium YRB3002]
MKRSIIAAVVATSLLMTACTSTVETTESTEVTTVVTEATTTEETTTEATTTEAATLDMTIDDVVEAVFGPDLPEGTPGDDFRGTWYIDDQNNCTKTFGEGVINAVICCKDVVLNESSPHVEYSCVFMIVEYDTESDIYKNLKEGDSFTVIYEIPEIPTTWEQPCPVSGINKQFVICVRDYYGYDTNAEPGQGVLEDNYAPFESADIQQCYEAFMALGT